MASVSELGNQWLGPLDGGQHGDDGDGTGEWHQR